MKRVLIALCSMLIAGTIAVVSIETYESKKDELHSELFQDIKSDKVIAKTEECSVTLDTSESETSSILALSETDATSVTKPEPIDAVVYEDVDGTIKDYFN